jgi:hypothetical protein
VSERKSQLIQLTVMSRVYSRQPTPGRSLTGSGNASGGRLIIGDSHLFSIDTESWKGQNAGMPRVARIVTANCPHHVTQRGNNRQDVFFVDDDRVTYLELLKEECEKHGVTVDGYCLIRASRGQASFIVFAERRGVWA